MVVTTHYGDILLDNTTWTKERSFIPRRCLFTGKWIMPFTTVMHGKRLSFLSLTLSGTPSQHYWASPEGLTVEKLKGNV